jgi:GxxExxY protein
LGPGFLEAVYQEAMEIELLNQEVPFESQKLLPILYKRKKLRKEYQSDLFCFGQIVVELKAQDKLTKKDESQVLNYLKATAGWPAH